MSDHLLPKYLKVERTLLPFLFQFFSWEALSFNKKIHRRLWIFRNIFFVVFQFGSQLFCRWPLTELPVHKGFEIENTRSRWIISSSISLFYVPTSDSVVLDIETADRNTYTSVRIMLSTSLYLGLIKRKSSNWDNVRFLDNLIALFKKNKEIKMLEMSCKTAWLDAVKNKGL